MSTSCGNSRKITSCARMSICIKVHVIIEEWEKAFSRVGFSRTVLLFEYLVGSARSFFDMVKKMYDVHSECESLIFLCDRSIIHVTKTV